MLLGKDWPCRELLFGIFGFSSDISFCQIVEMKNLHYVYSCYCRISQQWLLGVDSTLRGLSITCFTLNQVFSYIQEVNNLQLCIVS